MENMSLKACNDGMHACGFPFRFAHSNASVRWNAAIASADLKDEFSGTAWSQPTKTRRAFATGASTLHPPTMYAKCASLKLPSAANLSPMPRIKASEPADRLLTMAAKFAFQLNIILSLTFSLPLPLSLPLKRRARVWRGQPPLKLVSAKDLTAL